MLSLRCRRVVLVAVVLLVAMPTQMFVAPAARPLQSVSPKAPHFGSMPCTVRTFRTEMKSSKRDEEVGWAVISCIPFAGPAAAFVRACAKGDATEAFVQAGSFALDCATAGTVSTAGKMAGKAAKLRQAAQLGKSAAKAKKAAELAKGAELATSASKAFFNTDLSVKTANVGNKCSSQ